MEVVVAEKLNGIQWVYLVAMVICAGFLACAILIYDEYPLVCVIVAVMLIFFIVYSVVCFFMAISTPKIIAVYNENGIITFPEFSCRPREIERVEYKYSRAGKYRNTADHGMLYVYYKGKSYKYYFVKKLNQTGTRLIELITTDKEIEKIEQDGKNNG